MNRRNVLKGLAGTALGLGVAFNIAQADTESTENTVKNNEINVKDAQNLSRNGIVLHHGDNIDQTTIESLKYSIERLGYNVQSHYGGPDDAVASYAFGHNFPGAHYDAQTSTDLINELKKLATMNNMAIGFEAAP